MRLAERTVVLTGAAGGQGTVAAKLFAAEGARLLLTDLPDRGGEELANRLNPDTEDDPAAGRDDDKNDRALFVPADVTVEEEVRRVVARAVETFGGVDVLYHTAGVLMQNRQQPVDRLDEAVWETTLDVNLKGSYLFAKYVIPPMKKAGSGSLVFISSTAGLLGDPQAHAYSASKGGLQPLSRSIAQCYGPEGIRSNVIAPGFIDTPMIEEIAADEAAMEAIIERTALRRVGRPEEVAQMGLFLASEESSFVTGAVLRVDGGLIK